MCTLRLMDHMHFMAGQVDKVIYCGAIDKYVTIGRDGTFRLWNGPDLKHFRTMGIGSSWLTDCLYMPQVGGSLTSRGGTGEECLVSTQLSSFQFSSFSPDLGCVCVGEGE